MKWIGTLTMEKVVLADSNELAMNHLLVVQSYWSEMEAHWEALYEKRKRLCT